MSLFNEEKVPLGRYALRAIPPTSWAPPVHKSRATSRPKSTFSSLILQITSSRVPLAWRLTEGRDRQIRDKAP